MSTTLKRAAVISLLHPTSFRNSVRYMFHLYPLVFLPLACFSEFFCIILMNWTPVKEDTLMLYLE